MRRLIDRLAAEHTLADAKLLALITTEDPYTDGILLRQQNLSGSRSTGTGYSSMV